MSTARVLYPQAIFSDVFATPSPRAIGRIELSASGHVRFLNDAARAFLNLPPSVDDARCLARLIEIFPSLPAKLRGDRLHELDFRANREEDGENRTLRIVVCPISDERADVAALVLIEDVTAQVNLEKNIVRLSQLASLGVMTAEITHEINSPLMVIRGRAQQIISLCEEVHHSESQELNRLADLICRSTDRIVKMVKGLKGLAAGGELEDFESRPISGFIEELTELSKNRFVKFDAQLRIVSGADFSILCRPHLIIQVFMNLINNALDAIKDLDEKWVEISYSQTPDDTLITVTDSGKGIPVELQERITQPFFSTKPKSSNSGLGLSVCTSILLSHGGDLRLDTQCPNTRFVVRLPRNPGSQGER